MRLLVYLFVKTEDWIEMLGLSLTDFIFDPLLRDPLLGTWLMCIGSSLMGVVLLLKKKVLLAEALSHSAYPGILLALILFSCLCPSYAAFLPIFILAGALIASLGGLLSIEWLERKEKVKPDAALCFILSLFFVVGTVLSSGVQRIFPTVYGQIPVFLFGQAATMNDMHMILYGVLSLATVLLFFLIFNPMQAALFDRQFAQTLGIPLRFLEKTLFCLLLLSLILGMRSVGILLISAMTIGPAIAARALSDRLKTILWLAMLFGSISAVLGNIFSVWGTVLLSEGKELVNLPTGPSIVLVSSSIAVLALLLAPKKGWIFRLIRIFRFNVRCLEENLLKVIWKKKKENFNGLKKHSASFPFLFFWVLRRLIKKGWVIESEKGFYALTSDGDVKAASIVRLHRLWELYLSSELRFDLHKIHEDAEKMEHILTPAFEQKLTALLEDPRMDPHQQPIPKHPGRF
jgi:manganese/zinc/iron transport system permease protein